jgi:hypothetical protein
MQLSYRLFFCHDYSVSCCATVFGVIGSTNWSKRFNKLKYFVLRSNLIRVDLTEAGKLFKPGFHELVFLIWGFLSPISNTWGAITNEWLNVTHKRWLNVTHKRMSCFITSNNLLIQQERIFHQYLSETELALKILKLRKAFCSF